MHALQYTLTYTLQIVITICNKRLWSSLATLHDSFFILASFASKASIVAPLPVVVVRYVCGQLSDMHKLVTIYWSNIPHNVDI